MSASQIFWRPSCIRSTPHSYCLKKIKLFTRVLHPVRKRTVVLWPIWILNPLQMCNGSMSRKHFPVNGFYKILLCSHVRNLKQNMPNDKALQSQFALNDISGVALAWNNLCANCSNLKQCIFQPYMQGLWWKNQLLETVLWVYHHLFCCLLMSFAIYFVAFWHSLFPVAMASSSLSVCVIVPALNFLNKYLQGIYILRKTWKTQATAGC